MDVLINNYENITLNDSPLSAVFYWTANRAFDKMSVSPNSFRKNKKNFK